MSRFFDGVNDEIDFGDAPATKNLQRFTWVISFRMGVFQDNDILMQRASGGTEYVSVTLESSLEAGGIGATVIHDGTDALTITSGASLVVGNFYTVFVTYSTQDVVNTIYIYLSTNGGPVTFPTQTATPGTLGKTAEVGTLRLGEGSGGGGDFNGYMQNFMVFDDVLPVRLMNQLVMHPDSFRDFLGADGVAGSLVLYAPLNGQNSPEPDLSRFKQDGTVTGAGKGYDFPIGRYFRPSRRAYQTKVREGSATQKNIFLSQSITTSDDRVNSDTKMLSESSTVNSDQMSHLTKMLLQNSSIAEEYANHLVKMFSDAVTVTEQAQIRDLIKILIQNITISSDLANHLTKMISQSIGVSEGANIFLNAPPLFIELVQSITVNESSMRHLTKMMTDSLIVTELSNLQDPTTLVFLDSATTTFLNLQSGNAAPCFYIEGIISGVTSVFGVSFTASNWLIDGGVIDREKPILPGDRSKLTMSDVTIKLDNSTRRFSPDYTGSVFYNNNYLKSPVNYWAGFSNGSGACVLVQRGAFVLDTLRIDTRKNTAFLMLKDKFVEPLQIKLGRGASGTSIPTLFTGAYSTKLIMESLLITGAGLTAGDIDIESGHSSFINLSLSEQTIGDALAQLAEASDGYIYTTRQGKIKFKSQTPIWGTATTNFAMNDSGHYSNLFWEQDFKNRLSRVIVDFSSGNSSTIVAASSGQTASTKIIDNELINSTGDAIAISYRYLDRFSAQVTEIDVPALWFPSLDIGDKIDVVNQNAGLTGQTFEIFGIKEEPTKGRMRLKMLTDRSSRQFGKFCFFGDNSAVVCGTVFTGAPSETNGWQAEWAFFSYDEETAVNPGFDLEGNNNNVINTSYSASGIGGTGIEVPCQYY